MDFSSALYLISAFAYIAVTIYVANQEALTGQRMLFLRVMLYGIVVLELMLGLTLLQSAAFPPEGLENVNPRAAFSTFLLVVVTAILSVQLISQRPRVLNLMRWLSGGNSLYNPTSILHNTAVVLALALLTINIGAFVLGGGLAGFAQELETSGVSTTSTLFIAALQVALAFLGVGLAIRRSLDASLQRLGLRRPTREDVSWGIGIGIALYFVTITFVSAWQMFTPAEQVQQQTQASEQIARSFDTLPLAFIASVSVALGEEIAIRGALQPVFGLAATSAFFALLHTQYLITPGLLLIFVISLGLGWLRQRQSTTAAIIAHFVYNFIQLALLVLYLSASKAG